MAVPKKKTSTTKRNMRRSHHALKPINVVTHKYGDYQLQHNISAGGFYGKKNILTTKPHLAELYNTKPELENDDISEKGDGTDVGIGIKEIRKNQSDTLE